MTLHGDRVTCDVPGCGLSRACDWDDPGAAIGWRYFPGGRLVACPACRARYTDEQLREMIARKETT